MHMKAAGKSDQFRLKQDQVFYSVRRFRCAVLVATHEWAETKQLENFNTLAV